MNSTPNTTPLTDAFLYAGRASFVIRNGKGESVTVKVSKAKPSINRYTGKPWPETFFVSIRYQNDSWQYVGNVSRTSVKVVRSRKYVPSVDMDRAIAVAEWGMGVIVDRKSLPVGYSIEHTGRCGVCYKMLRDPESIALGIGPVCRG